MYIRSLMWRARQTSRGRNKRWTAWWGMNGSGKLAHLQQRKKQADRCYLPSV